MARGPAKFEQKTYGRVRYITYFMHFPSSGGEDYWVDQRPLVHDLNFEIQNMKGLNKDPDKVRKLLKNGECSWKDHNGVTHQVVIEEKKRARKWGIQRQ